MTWSQAGTSTCLSCADDELLSDRSEVEGRGQIYSDCDYGTNRNMNIRHAKEAKDANDPPP